MRAWWRFPVFRTDAAVLHAGLTAAPRGASGEHGAAQVCITRALVAGLSSLVEQIKILTDQIDKQLGAHVDAHIFTSLAARRNHPRGKAVG